MGRFISADGVVSGAGGSVQGYNVYTYCMNNPVNMSDASGHWPKWVKNVADWVNDKIIEPTKTALGDIGSKVIEDIKNLDLKNESEEKVLESNYFSSYKGKLVVRTNSDRSCSFGALFITRETNERANPEDVIRHEYGHTKQLQTLGIVKYTLCIGIPSCFEWGSDDEYYRRPWEITADIYGGVQSRSYPGYEEAGFDYLGNSIMWGVFVWLTID